jgi:tartrate dehydratase beta subunit/fumarate hydratase class I family protein
MAIVVAIQMGQAMLTYQWMWPGGVALTITKVVRELQWVQIGMQAVISILVKELALLEMIMTMGRTKATKDSK